MVAILTGKPLPEEDDGAGEWAESLLVDREMFPAGGGAGAKKPSAVPPRQAPAQAAPAATPIAEEPARQDDEGSIVRLSNRSAEELSGEPADGYYHRIFEEYIVARDSLGQETSMISYPRFVEKLVKHERILCRKQECKQIRFNIVMRDGKVILSPVAVA